tara:strand:- start:31134 stop:31544 length:411 start_codon:yes stop_codon:yes gene_type:complete
MKIFDLLIVEDDDGDVELMQETLPEDIEFRYRRALNGEEAMSSISASLPDIIFLDLNMPKIDGRQVLTSIKQDPRYKKVPVIVISTSINPEDIKLSYELGANAYLTKSGNFDEFSDQMQRLGDFWFRHVLLPPVDI